MKRTNLVDLMQRYITGQVTEQERKKIEVWLDLKKTEEGEHMVLSPEDEERLFRQLTSSIDGAEQVKAFRPLPSRKRYSNRWLAIAASIIILAMSSYTVWFFASRTAAHETVTTARAEKTILDDGSIVWLRKASRLTYGNYDNVRRATFTGEALFEVAKDPHKPFTIACGAVKVEVVGTSFNIKSAGGFFELKVLTGKVKLSTTTNAEGMFVNAHEMVVYSPAGGISKTMIDEDQVRETVARTDYNMAFRNTTMRNVLAKIEKKFDVKIQIEQPVLNDCRITADFTDNSLEGTMEMLAELLDIGFEIGAGRVTISGKGCN